jgi:hypothetical protein
MGMNYCTSRVISNLVIKACRGYNRRVPEETKRTPAGTKNVLPKRTF